jgi:gliding motility-associated-like protein
MGIMEQIEISDPASSIFLSIYETDKRLKLSWNEQVPWKNEEYIIYRSKDNTQMYDSLATTNTTFYEDFGLTNGETYCYYVKSVGQYVIPDTIAPLYNRSQMVCGVPVDNIPPDKPATEISTDCKTVSFVWFFRDTVSYLDAYRYYIYYQPNYQTPLVCIDSFTYSIPMPCDSTAPCTHTIQNLLSITGCYAMLIKDEAGNYSEMTEKLCFDVDECDTYRLPNVFTPNGDEINDTWYPFPYTNVQKIYLDVHDRWGKLVFRTQDPDINWDGRDRQTHRPLPDGTYYYGCDVYLYTLDGIKKKFLNGIIMILRGNNTKQNY